MQQGQQQRIVCVFGAKHQDAVAQVKVAST
jgi:hypothetical protein